MIRWCRPLLGLLALLLPLATLAQENLGPAHALPVITQLVKDQDFRQLPKPLPTSASPGGKEVIVFFFYDSPWCAKAAPYIKAWQDEGNADLRITWAPAVLADRWGYGARVFFALELLDKNPELTLRLIQAYAGHQVTYGDTASLEKWLTGQGVKVEEFEKALNDGRNVARTAWVPQVMELYTVKAVPTLIINGKYVVEASEDSDPAAVVARARYIVEHAGPADSSP